MKTEKRFIDANELDSKLEALAQKYAAQGRFEAAKDYIAHGVTVQEWISVKDRLPENICPVLVSLKGLKKAFLGRYQDSEWWSEGAGSRPFMLEVTHWMPLPQPPKGE